MPIFGTPGRRLWASVAVIAALTGCESSTNLASSAPSKATPRTVSTAQPAPARLGNASLLHLNYAFALQPKWRGWRSAEEHHEKKREFLEFLQQAVVRSQTDSAFRRVAEFAKDILEPQAGQPSSVIASLSARLSQGETASLRWQRGTKLYYAGHYAEALVDLKRVVELVPESFGALSTIGKIYLRQKRYGAAQRYLDQALALDPMNPEAFMLRAAT